MCPQREDQTDRMTAEALTTLLRERLRSKEQLPGELMPTQKQLAEQYGVSRATVQKALDKLKEEGWVRSVRGSGTYVADPEAQELATVTLAEWLEQALKVPKLELDVYSFTVETLYHALSGPLGRARVVADAAKGGDGRQGNPEERQLPDEIHVRLLMPAVGPTLVLPCPVNGPTDARLIDRAARMMRRHAWNIHQELHRLQEVQLVDRVKVEIRRVAMVPSDKIYLRRGQEVLYGTYAIRPRTLKLDGENLEVRDIFGLGARLKRFAVGEGPDGGWFVSSQQERFNDLWDWAEPEKPFSELL